MSAALDRAGRERAPEVGEPTRRELAAFQRNGADRGAGQVAGIVWKQANRMAAHARKSANRPAGLRDALVIRLMSDCLLRVGEAEALDVEDLAFVGRDLRVLVRRSKTDQSGAGVLLYAGPPAAYAARRWLKAAGIQAGRLFRAVNKAGRVQGARLSSRSIRDIVKRWAAAGVGGRVSGHSLRVGAAQSQRRGGRDDAGGRYGACARTLFGALAGHGGA